MSSALLARFHFRSDIIVCRATASCSSSLLPLLNSGRWQQLFRKRLFLVLRILLSLVFHICFSSKPVTGRHWPLLLILICWIFIQSQWSIRSNCLISILANFNLLTLWCSFLSSSSKWTFSFSVSWLEITSHGTAIHVHGRLVSVRLHSTCEWLTCEK